MKHIFFLLITFFPIFIFSQNYTINGYIRDASSGEVLNGATFFLNESKKGTYSNAYGFYSISIPQKDSVAVTISYIGYQPQFKIVRLNENIRLNVDLQPAASTLDEVVISAEQNNGNVQNNEMSVIDLSIETINSLPVIFGERDPLKAIQALPGVQAGNEGTTGYFVRGGNADQNLVLLDEAIVYNPNHIFGLFSTFNSRAISHVKLVKGGFPAEYGGRLSSVLDISMKEGDMKKLHVDGGIGITSASIGIDGPIIEDKMSFMVSARRSYADLVTRLIDTSIAKYYFYDFNAKVNYRISDKDRLFISFFNGRDKASYSAANSLNYNHSFGNSTGTLRWNHLFNRKLFSNTSFIINDYDLEVRAVQAGYLQQIGSGIKDISVKTDFDYYASPQHTIKFGGVYTYHRYAPISNVELNSGAPTSGIVQEKKVSESALYLSDDIKISPRFGLNLGVRVPLFVKKDVHYLRIEPRATFRANLTESMSLKMAFSQVNQYINLIANSTASVPTDIFIPSSATVKPQVSNQAALGIFKNFNNNSIEASIEGYYKTMKNQVLIKEGEELSTRFEIDEQLTFGEGWSYGMEFFLRKKTGRFKGWVAYTLAWSWQKFPELNFGEKFPFRYDRRHNLSVTGSYQLTKRWTVATNFVLRSGNAITLPTGRLNVNNGGTLYNGYFYDYTARNSFRMPIYHRLDITASHKKNGRLFNKPIESEWVFGLYNAYSRRNTFYIYLAIGDNGEPQVRQTNLLPVIPSITYNFKF